MGKKQNQFFNLVQWILNHTLDCLIKHPRCLLGLNVWYQSIPSITIPKPPGQPWGIDQKLWLEEQTVTWIAKGIRPEEINWQQIKIKFSDLWF